MPRFPRALRSLAQYLNRNIKLMDIETKKFLLEIAVKIAQKNIEQKITRKFNVHEVSEVYFGLCAILDAQTIVDDLERLKKLNSIK